MAAPIRLWLLGRAPRIFLNSKLTNISAGLRTTYPRNKACNAYNGAGILGSRVMLTCLRAVFARDPVKTISVHQKNTKNSFLNFSRKFSSDESDGGKEPPKNSKGPLKLMNFQEIVWPHPLKSLRNLWFSMLIRGYFDNSYSPETFLKGAEQAVMTVSGLVSEGRFDDLESMVSRDAIREVRKHFHDLTIKQRKFIKVDPRDLFFRFVYEIGMIFDDNTNQRFVEITAVFQGIHGMSEFQQQSPSDFSEHMKNSQDQVYVCNYRFIREFTKGVEDSWTINKLNHFSPKELVANSGIFQR